MKNRKLDRLEYIPCCNQRRAEVTTLDFKQQGLPSLFNLLLMAISSIKAIGGNPPTERFFPSLKHEQLNYGKSRAKEAAKLGIIDYLAFYNGKRTHSKLGCQAPLEFEREFYKKTA